MSNFFHQFFFFSLSLCRRRVLGEIDLQMVSVNGSFEVDRQHTFKIMTLMKQHLFAAQDDDEVEKWIAAIGFGSSSVSDGFSGRFKRFSTREKRRTHQEKEG